MNRYRIMLIAAGFAVVVAFSGVSVRAAEHAAPQFPKQVVLTKGQVERVVATLGPAEALSKKYKTDDAADYHGGDIGTTIRQALTNSGALSEFNAIVGKQGFTGFDDWWPVAFSVMTAAQPEAFSDNDANMAEAVTTIQNNQKMTPQQKAQALARMKQSSAVMEQMRPLPQNVTTVAPYATEVKRLVQTDE